MYKWVVASKGTSFLAAYHKLSISARGTIVTVGYDGTPVLIGSLPMVTRGLVGITTATGDQTNAVAVRNVKASFYDCAP